MDDEIILIAEDVVECTGCIADSGRNLAGSQCGEAVLANNAFGGLEGHDIEFIAAVIRSSSHRAFLN